MTGQKKLGPWRVETVCVVSDPAPNTGLQVMDGDDTVVAMMEGNGWSKAAMKRIMNLIAASPQMLSDMEAFLDHFDRCDSAAEVAAVATDMAVLFRQSVKLATKGRR